MKLKRGERGEGLRVGGKGWGGQHKKNVRTSKMAGVCILHLMMTTVMMMVLLLLLLIMVQLLLLQLLLLLLLELQL